MKKQHHKTARYHRLSYPLIITICLLLALVWVFASSADEAVLAASAVSESSVDASPIAVDDAYTTTGYSPLDIPAPGVLANDSDPDGDPFTATLYSGPNVGSVVLNSDGSFVYQPVPGFWGTDTFTYIAGDGDAPAQAYWPFEEGSGTTTADATGNGFDGTLTNGPTFTTTIPVTPTFSSYAIDFDGVDDFIQTPAVDLANNSFSVAFWARRDSSGRNDYVLGQGTGSSNYGLHVGFRNSDVFTCAFWGNDLNTPSTYTDTNWHHWACTFDANTNERIIYFDGMPVATDTASSDYLGSGSFYIGSYFNGGGPFDGVLDDVRVYMVPLTQSQVQAAMTSDQLALGDTAAVNITVPYGVLSGEVTNSSNGDPIANVTVIAAYDASTDFTTLSDDSGIYELVMAAETFTVTANAFGYEAAQFASVSVPPGVTTTLDIALDLASHYVVDGVVTDANTGWPLYASIDINGYPGDPIWTDPETGYYSISLPEGITYTFNVVTWLDGYLANSRDIGPLNTGTTEDFALDVDTSVCNAPGYTQDNLFYDGFESGDLSAGWIISTTNEGRVQVTTDYPYSGDYSVLLDDSIDGGLTSIAGIVLPIDLSSEPQVNLDFWWREFGDENDSEDGVFISDDNGTTWCPIYSFNNGPSEYINTQLDLTAAATGCGMTLGANTQIKFQFYDNFAVPTDGYAIDEVKINQTCNLPADGGLVVGHVYDNKTLEVVNGSVIENEAGFSAQAVATPLDDDVEDAFYSIFSPSGSQIFTATMNYYGSDVDTISVVMSDTISHDFYLPAGWLEATPDSLAVTLDLGDSITLPLTLSNAGAVDANFELGEFHVGFTPVSLRSTQLQGTIEWLYHDSDGVAVRSGDIDNGLTTAYPGAYRYTPANVTSDSTILVYTDDWVHTTPNTLVQQALSILGLPATVHVDGDYAGFETSLITGGPWDLVIWSGENYAVSSSTLTALLNYLQSGGNLVATYWQQLEYPTDPLWAEMGFNYVSNYVTPPPVYWWEADHPIFSSPESVPEWLNRVQNSGNSQGTRLEPLTNGIALAGYTTSPATNEAGIILRDDGKALYKGLRDVSTNADDDIDSILDGTELWVNIINYMLYGGDVPWLFEEPITGTVTALGNTVVDVTFDAGVVAQPGEYSARIITKNDTPYGSTQIPVTMTVNTPPTWGKVEGNLTLLGYCDADPTTPNNQEILIEGSSGFTATTKTDENGYYQWWIDPSESPLTVTVSPPDYETGVVSGVMIVTDQTTTVDFDLRLLKPCVSLNPSAYEKVIFLGDVLTDSLNIFNMGALSTTFDITETSPLPWLSETPSTGIVDQDSSELIDIIFDSSVLTQTGQYLGELRVDSDDPVTGSSWIPVDMTVVSGTPGVALSADSTLIGQPGLQVTHTFTVTNTGEVTDIYDLALTGNQWVTTGLPVNTSFMTPGESFTITVVVEIPNNPTMPNAIIGSDNFTLTASSQLDGSSAVATGTTNVEVATGVSLSGDQSSGDFVGAIVTYTLQVTNSGSYTDTFNLEVGGNVWVTDLSLSSLTLNAGATGEVVVSVAIPVDAPDGTLDQATITATSTNDPLTMDQVVLSTSAFKYRLYLPIINKP